MGSFANPSIVPPAVIIVETQVFNGASPVAWTDLDLSGVIGAQPTQVILKFNSSTGYKNVGVRKNGDTDNFYEVLTGSGKGLALTDSLASSGHAVLLCLTDPAGIIEWKAETVDVFAIDVMAYSK